MNKTLLTGILLLIVFSSFSFANEWIQNSSINASLPAYDIFSTPAVFQWNSAWYLLSGSNNGNISGFDWNGTGWTANASINRSITHPDFYSVPTVFQLDSQLQMIVGYWSNSLSDFNGFSWNGTDWNDNATLINGLSSVISLEALYNAPTVFRLPDGNLYLIDMVNNRTFPTDHHLFIGYGWNGTGWDFNATIIAGLPTGSARLNPTVFVKNGTTYLVYGSSTGQFSGFEWNGMGWSANSYIVAGLPDVGSNAAPTSFNISGVQLISGNAAGNYIGFNWNETFFPPQITINSPTNTSYSTPISISLDYTIISTVNTTFTCNTTINGTGILNDTVTNNTNAVIPLNITNPGFYGLNTTCTDNDGTRSKQIYFTIFDLPSLVDFAVNKTSILENTELCVNATITSGTYEVTNVDAYFSYPDGSSSSAAMQNSTSIDGCGGGGAVWSININVGAAFSYPASFFTIDQFDITDADSNIVSNSSFTSPTIVVYPPGYFAHYTASDIIGLVIDTGGSVLYGIIAMSTFIVIGLLLHFSKPILSLIKLNIK